jgi:glycosyltransferase involved in cell wall biosynthesis
LLGYRKDIPNLLRASDIFIFPSIREGLGMAALEAMASGLPLIASHINGIKDYTLNGTTGYNFNPRNKKQLAKLILKLSFNSEMRNKVSKTNQEISHTYDLDIVKVEIDNILTEIIFKSP